MKRLKHTNHQLYQKYMFWNLGRKLKSKFGKSEIGKKSNHEKENIESKIEIGIAVG